MSGFTLALFDWLTVKKPNMGGVKHKNPCVLSQMFDAWFYKGELIDANCGKNILGT